MVRMLCLSQPSLVQVPSVLEFSLICESQLAEVMAEAMAEVDQMMLNHDDDDHGDGDHDDDVDDVDDEDD